MKKALLIVFSLAFIQFSFGQTVIFDVAGGGTLPSGWTATNNVTTYDIDRGSYYLVDAGNPSDIIETNVIDLSAYSDATFDLRIASFGSGGHNSLKIEISNDGGASYSQTEITNATTSSSYFDITTINIPSVTSQMKLKFSNNGTSGRGVRMQDFLLQANNNSAPTVGFDNATSSETETNMPFTVNIPVTMSNYGGSQVDLLVTATPLTAEAGDFSLQTSSLSFTADGSMNIDLQINDDADFDDETLELTISETTGTGVIISTAVHTLTIIDDDIPPSVGFDNATSSETETNMPFTVNIPVTMSNYGGSQVDLLVTATPLTAEAGDFSLQTSSLSFTADGSLDIAILINDDADFDDETLELTISETSGTGVTISTAVHTLTIIDDEGVQPGDLVINEIHYNPCTTQGSDTDYEFFEIHNPTANSFDISNFQVANIVSFTFPATTTIAAGEYIVLANTSATYSGNGYQVFEYSGQLTNSAKTIELLDDTGAEIDIVTYIPNTGGDGNCRSLELSDPTMDNVITSNSNWGQSATTNGTPGAANIILPIELISFTAKEKNNSILLSWQTATEINNSHFEIERSRDGQYFETINIIEGAGTTAEVQNYSFIDNSPSNGINFYRLKQVDFDGVFDYTQTISVDMSASNDWNLYPTHSQNEINVEWPEEIPATTISIFDVNGKLIYTEKADTDANQISISTSNFPEGMYFLRMMADRTTSTKSFFRVR